MKPYLYTGQHYDDLTDLYHLRARYYDSAVGRFLSRDPYPVNLYDPFELNRYIYAGNDPVNFSDPTGTVSLSEYGINLSTKSPAIVILKGAGTGALVSMLSDLAFQYVIEVVVGGRDFQDWISDPDTWTQAAIQGVMGAVTGGVGAALGAGMLGGLGRSAFAVVGTDAILDIGLGTAVDVFVYGDDPLAAVASNTVGWGLSFGVSYAIGRTISGLRGRFSEHLSGGGEPDMPHGWGDEPDVLHLPGGDEPAVPHVSDDPGGRGLGDELGPSEGIGGSGRDDDLVPGTPEHKAARWQKYQNDPNNKGMDYETWEKKYEPNMRRARKAQAEVEEYAKTLDWGSTKQVTLPTPHGGRRLDVVDLENSRGLEYKSGQYFDRGDPGITSELAKDAYLVTQSWQIEWVFKATKGVSEPLVSDLKQAGITVIVNGIVR